MTLRTCARASESGRRRCGTGPPQAERRASAPAHDGGGEADQRRPEQEHEPVEKQSPRHGRRDENDRPRHKPPEAGRAELGDGVCHPAGAQQQPRAVEAALQARPARHSLTHHPSSSLCTPCRRTSPSPRGAGPPAASHRHEAAPTTLPHRMLMDRTDHG